MRTRTHLPRLFAGHDAGGWTLPNELLASRRAVDTLTAASRYGLTEPAARDALDAATVAAARNGDPLPDPSPVLDARRADEAAQIVLDIAQQAGEREAERLVALAVDLGDAIITDHLRPALGAAVADGANAYAKYADVGTDALDLLTAPAAARTAFVAIEEPARRYAAVRAARVDLHVAGYAPQLDGAEVFGLFRNGTEVWPLTYDGRGSRNPPPWPSDPRELFVWIVAGNAQPWLPTRRRAGPGVVRVRRGHASRGARPAPPDGMGLGMTQALRPRLLAAGGGQAAAARPGTAGPAVAAPSRQEIRMPRARRTCAEPSCPTVLNTGTRCEPCHNRAARHGRTNAEGWGAPKGIQGVGTAGVAVKTSVRVPRFRRDAQHNPSGPRERVGNG